AEKSEKISADSAFSAVNFPNNTEQGDYSLFGDGKNDERYPGESRAVNDLAQGRKDAEGSR
ncbi:MAG: hypothetical protein ACUVTV_10725, partial [Anaerolineae bacterium]